MRGLVGDVLLMAAATGASRLLGLVRDATIAGRFGASAAYDAFLIAFFVPHFLRQLLAEGALSVAFVPIYTDRRLVTGDGDRFAGNLLSLLLILFPITVAVGVLLAPVYVPFLASGFGPEKTALTVSLTRMVFPFIALVGYAAVFMGLLNAHHRFFTASLAPVWFNLGMIIGVLFLAPRMGGAPIYGLAAGVLIGGCGQLAFQAFAMRGLGLRLRFHLFPLHPGIREMARRMLPAVLAMAVTQVNLLVDNKLASHLGDGGIASLQYAMRLFQLPLGVFAVSIAMALLPRFSASLARRRDEEFSRQLTDGSLASLIVLLPAMTGLLILGSEVIRLLFEHGSFGPADTLRTARALSFYLVGLVPYGLVYVFTRAAYALGTTRLPLIASVCAVAVNVTLDLLLVGPMREAGLALATAIAGGVNAAVLLFFLRRRIAWSGRLRQLGTVAAGSAGLALVVWATWTWIPGGAAASVFVPMTAGILFYLGFVRATSLWSLVRSLGVEGQSTSSSGGEGDQSS